MKKLLISTAVAVSLGLTGCGGGDELAEIQNETPVERPFARILFDPAASNLNVPNDLLLLPSADAQLFDFTLQTDGGEPFDPSNPLHAVSALDGWSTQHPFNIDITLPAGVTVDAGSLANPSTIRIFEASQVLENNSAACQQIAAVARAPGVPCEVGAELVLGQDFVTSLTGPGRITVLPLRPLKAAQGYLMVVTDSLQDNFNRSVRGSTTWELGLLDPVTEPLSSDAQRQLQGLVNFIALAAQSQGIERDNITYATYFSTVSAGTVTGTVKQLQIGGFAQALATALGNGADPQTAAQIAAQFLPAITVSNPTAAPNAFEVLASNLIDEATLGQLTAVGLNTCSGLLGALQDPTGPLFATAAATFAQVGPFCAADRKEGNINLPYYLSVENPLGDWWRAACTNGAMLQSLGQETVGQLLQNPAAVGPYNDLCQAASGGQLFDLNLAAIGIDDPRHLTKVSPVPAQRGNTASIDVQITVPNEQVIAILASQSDLVQPITRPEGGWPVVVIQHGITASKESALAIAGTLSLAGFATVAIDHPLHGSRGINLTDGEGNVTQIVNATGGSGGSTTDYLNLSSLLTARDNLRQSIVDTLGLRLGLNAVVDTTGSVMLDSSNVHFLGQSLGSITGVGTVALANRSLGGDLANFDNMFAFQSAALSVPGGGMGGFLLESASFGPLIKGSLLAASSPDFVAFLTAYAQENQLPAQSALAPAFLAFEQGLTEAQLAEINGTFASFAFAAQTVIDAGDPNNYAALLASNTPIMVHEVVGGGTNDDGSTALPDQVIPNTTNLPLAGTEPLAAIMGLNSVVSSTTPNGIVRFTAGSHSSLLSPAASVAATTEMQRQVAAFFASGGTAIVVNDPSVIAN